LKLLSVDTSTDYLALAVTDGGKTLSRLNRKAPRSHSSLLMPMIDRLLKKARIKLKDIDGYCVGVGPGSFTGLRIGITTVKGLASVTNKPIVAVPTFDAIAQNAKKLSGVICVALDARKSKVYGSFYSSDGAGLVRRASKHLLLPAAELLKSCEKYDTLYFIGDYAERMAALRPKAGVVTDKWHPRAESIAAVGAGLFAKKKFVSAEKLEPMYIYSRECDIKGI
jgi:tRNA threonylcarbamoyladenosine biosynthesis protein TsaB